MRKGGPNTVLSSPMFSGHWFLFSGGVLPVPALEEWRWGLSFVLEAVGWSGRGCSSPPWW